MTDHVADADFQVADWHVHVDRYELRRGDEVRRVQPRLIALLACLARADGRTVSREVLLDAVWRRRMVNDEVLSRAIADLRRALDDDARQSAVIETVPKLGYRLCVPVRFVQSEADSRLPVDHGDHVGVPATAAAAELTRGGRLVGLGIALLAVLAAVITVITIRGSAGTMPAVDLHGLVPADLLHARPLAVDASHNLTPRFSRRGGLFAFSAVSQDGRSAVIQLRSRDGRVNTSVENHGDWDICPVFSGDGGDLIWARHGAGGCRLMRQAIAGGEQQELGRCAARLQSCPDLSPDGRHLLFSSDAWTGLAELNLHSGSVREVTRLHAGLGTDADPRYAADGEHVAFLRGQSSDRELMVLAPGASQPRRIDLPPARVYGLAWLDHRHVLLATDSEGARALVAVAIDDGQRQLLGAPGARRPDRADDGALIWEVANYQAHVWRLQADGTELELGRHPRSDGHPALSPEGGRLVFQSNREGPDSVWLMELDTDAQRRLPLPGNTLWLYPAWLRDGDGLVLVGQSGGINSAWRYRFDSAAPERIEAIPEGVHELQVAEDGALWFLRDDDTGQRRMQRLPAGSGVPEMVIDSAVATLRAHRDGVYFQPPESNALWRCATDARDCRDTGIRLGSSSPGTWALSDQAVFHQQPQPGGGVRIMRRHLHGEGADEETGWTMPTLLPRGLTVTADGNVAYVVRATLRSVELAWLPPVDARVTR